MRKSRSRVGVVVCIGQATLRVAGGDRTKAINMLQDPDALMANPEVQRIIAEGADKSGGIEVVEGVCSGGENVRAAAGGAREDANGRRRGKQLVFTSGLT